MRTRSIVTSTSLMLTLAIMSGCGDTADTPPPPADVTVANDPPAMSGLPADTPITAGSPSGANPPAQSPGQTPAAGASGGADPALVSAGQQVFTGAGLCQACHGPTAQGTALGPNLTDGEWIWITESGEDLATQLATIIRTGIAQPREYPAPMPPGGGGTLSDDQVAAVAAYVASLN